MKRLISVLSNPIARSFLGIAGITVVIRVVGYFEKLLLAYKFGTGPSVDSYMVVFTFIMSVFVFFRELIEPGFLNTFLSAREQRMEQSAWNIFNSIGRLVLLISVIMTVVVEIWPAEVIRFIAPGFSGQRLDVAITMIRIAFPAAIFLNLSSLTNITLNSFKIFILPAAADFVLKAAIVLALMVLVPVLGIYAVVAGLVFGSILKLAIHLSQVYDNVSFRRTPIDPVHRRQIIKLTIPLMLGVSFSQFSSLAENMFASYLQEGMISSIAYARKIVELPVMLFPYLLSTVLFPFFSQAIISKDPGESRELFSTSMKWIIVVFIPVSIFLMFYAEPIVAIIFQRGAFDENSTALTMKPLMIYSTGVLFFAIETVLVVFFYANSNTREPILVGVFCVVLNLLLTYVLINHLSYLAIPLGYVVSKIVKVAVLSLLLVHRGEIALERMARFLLRGCIGGIAFVLIVVFANRVMPIENSSLLTRVSTISAVGVCALVIYFVLLSWLRVLPLKKQ